MVYKVFYLKIFGGTVKNENVSNQVLTEELQKPIIIKLYKQKVYSAR